MGIHILFVFVNRDTNDWFLKSIYGFCRVILKDSCLCLYVETEPVWIEWIACID